jgi:hypothetical protein
MINRESWQYLKEDNQNRILRLFAEQTYIMLWVWFLMWFTLSYYVWNNETYYVLSEILLIIIITYFFIKYMKKWKLTNTRIDNNTKWINWEKKVSYELDMLRSKYSNFYIINNYQRKNKWDIDHIIISEKWIFAIETKNYSSYVKNETIDKHAKYIRGGWIYLRDLLKDNFWIKFVHPLLIYVGKNIDRKNEFEKVIPVTELKNIIKNTNDNIPINNIKQIHDFLNNKQQNK